MSDEDVRVTGFVIGSDISKKGAVIWKVRVQDSGSGFDRGKLIVASTHEGITIAQGLNVTFLVGTVKGPKGGNSLRAVVRLLNEGQKEEKDESDG